MSLPWMIWNHKHLSQRERGHYWPNGWWDDAKWEDCGWASLVEVLRAAGYNAPLTMAYAEHLRYLSGLKPSGGSRATHLALAMKKKYGITVPVQRSFNDLWRALVPGTVAGIGGRMGVFPVGHRLRRHSPRFNGAHNVTIFRVDSTDRVWWCDPLAPTGEYEGEWVTKDELRRYIVGLPGVGHVVLKIKQAAKPPVPKPPVPKPPVPKPPAPKPPTPSAKLYHTVMLGDSLWAIAIEYKTTVANLRALNPGVSTIIRPGDKLRVK